jgi:CHAD domain-containing protein
VLGEVRDLDVLGERLREAVVLLGLVTETDPLFEELVRRREGRRLALVGAIDGDRYAALRRLMIDEARSPGGADEGGRTDPARLQTRLVKDWRRLLEEVASTPPDAPIEALHELRKRAKRTRYAAESAVSWRGDRGARKIARRSREVQEILGLLQDAAVADAFVREVRDLLPPGDGPTRSAVETLLDHQRRQADEALRRYGELRGRLSGF